MSASFKEKPSKKEVALCILNKLETKVCSGVKTGLKKEDSSPYSNSRFHYARGLCNHVLLRPQRNKGTLLGMSINEVSLLCS